MDRAGIRPKGLNLNNEWVKTFLYQFVKSGDTVDQSLESCLKDRNNSAIVKTHVLKNMAKWEHFFQLSLTYAQKALIRQYLVDLDFKTAKKTLLAVEVDKLLLDCPGLRQQAYSLSTIPGISTFSAVWILAEIGSIDFLFLHYRIPTYIKKKKETIHHIWKLINPR